MFARVRQVAAPVSGRTARREASLLSSIALFYTVLPNPARPDPVN